MRIALDAMGTDSAPAPEVAGALLALRDAEGVEITLVGDEEIVRRELERHDAVPDTLSVRHAPDRVTAEDSAASVIRRKPESSIVDSLSTDVIGGTTAKVLTWYDNEWGYSNRLVDALAHMGNVG